jgi:DNA-binding MarR family transcriptional regulator
MAGMGDVPHGPAGAGPAVPARLSQVLTAFIIECDNEFEHRMPHRTTRHGSAGDLRHPPWLVSMAMWANCLRFVPPGGIAAGELARQARLTGHSMGLVLTRMSRWWGYLTVTPGAAASRVVAPTRAGRQAQEIWAPLPGEISDRWRKRFGAGAVEGLAAALARAVGEQDMLLPDFLPVGQAEPAAGRPFSGGLAPSRLTLPELLSKVLLACALDFESASDLALGVYTDRGAGRLEISANVLRVLDDGGTRVRDLPAATGVAQMAIGNWLGRLDEHRYLSVGADPGGGRFKVARLTPRGRAAREAYRRWAAADGQVPGAAALRAALGALDGELLLSGTVPYPDGWRAQVRRPAALPHYPVISPRGGFPDGS